MKKVLSMAAVLLGATAICVSNFTTTSAQAPSTTNHYVVKDTVPSDTMQTKDSTLLKF